MEDKILEEFNELIQDLSNELINSSDLIDTRLDEALKKTIEARRSWQIKKFNQKS